MWHEFSIGNVKNHGSAAAVIGELSENDKEYWWHDDELEIGGKIAKDTKEGKAIAVLIRSGGTEKRVQTHLRRMAVTALSPNTVVRLIHRAREAGFKAGEESRASAIREALGIVAE